MSDLVQIGRVNELKRGDMTMVMVNGQEILLARVDDTYYAADNICPHMGGKLANGKLEGTVVTCPRHSSRFDLTDGHVVRWLSGAGIFSTIGRVLKSPRPLTVYKTKLEGEKILAEI
jgi:3-phenylpropionate/trans-cinnamate dioxygenase ferredoxin subunit